jgi:DNA-directed RNA polymerase specialized sigma subunit
MIRTENEYQEAVKQLREQEGRLRGEEQKLRELNLSHEEIKRGLDPQRTFHEQIKQDVESYERLRRGEFEELHNFQGIGRMLIALRIYQGLTQRELAEELGVHETQVSRDEKNEYHGVTMERASRILETLGVDVVSAVENVRRLKSSGQEAAKV